VQTVSEDEAGAHPGAQDDGHDRVVFAVALSEELGQGQAVGVVFDDEGHSELGPEQADEAGLFVERRVGRAVHDVVGGMVGPRGSHAHGFVPRAAGGLGHQLEDVGDDLLPAQPGLGGPAHPGQDLAIFIDETGLDFRPAEVDPDRAPAHVLPQRYLMRDGPSEATGTRKRTRVPAAKGGRIPVWRPVDPLTS